MGECYHVYRTDLRLLVAGKEKLFCFGVLKHRNSVVLQCLVVMLRLFIFIFTQCPMNTFIFDTLGTFC